MDKQPVTELELINYSLRRFAREHDTLKTPATTVLALQERRMEIIAGVDWQEKLNSWIQSGQEFKSNH